MKSRHLALLTPLVLLSVLFSVLSDASNLGGTGGGGGSGSLSMGSLDGTTAAVTGAVISGSSLYMQSASATVPGLVNTTSQVMAGAKRFQDNLYVGSAPSDALPFNVDATMVTSAGSYFAGNVIGRRTVSSTDSTSSYGNLSQVNLTVAAGQSNHATTAGLLGEAKTPGAGTTDFAAGVRGVVTNTGAGGVTGAAAFLAGTMVNSGGGSISNTYGLYVNNNTVGTTNYPIYSIGTTESYFTGGGSLSAGKFFVSNEGNLSKVNNVYYNWPASQGSATTYLKNDGSGNLSWATVAAGTGDVVGPSSSVDGQIATFNSTTGKLIRAESKFTVNSTTGAIAKTFAGGPTTLESLDIGTATTWTQARLVTGTNNNTPSTGYIDRYNFTFDVGSTNRSFHMSSVAPTISGSTSALIAREHVSMIGTSSGTSAGGQFASLTGVVGNFTAMYNTNSTGLGIAHYGWMNANKAVGARGLAYAGQGSSGRAIGVNGVATTENNPSIASAGYFVMGSTISSGAAETGTAFPSISGALIVDTGDVATTIPAFVAMNNGGSVFQVRGTGDTVIGAHGGTATHVMNGHLKVYGQVASIQDTEAQAAATTHTIDWNGGNSTEWDLQAATGNITLTLSNPVKGASYIIKIIQSSTARTVTWPSNVKWPSATAPTLTTTNDAVDVISLYYDGVNYLGSYALDIR